MGLINADKLLEHLYNKQTEQCDVALEIAEFPTVDAVEVVHGKWLHNSIENPLYRICDQCASIYRINDGDGAYNLCPNCGARMDGERRSGE
jgi:hypothetical protein